MLNVSNPTLLPKGEAAHILLMNLSLLTGRPFLPLCTGVSVHISFCGASQQLSQNPAVKNNPRAVPVITTILPVLTTFSRILPPSQQSPSKSSYRIRTYMLQWRSKALTLASLSTKTISTPSQFQVFVLHATHSLRFDRMLISTCE